MSLTKKANIMRAALTGAGVGGLIGGAKGLYDSHGGNMLQSSNRLESTLGGALKGMGAGAMIGGGYGLAKPLWSKAAPAATTAAESTAVKATQAAPAAQVAQAAPVGAIAPQATNEMTQAATRDALSGRNWNPEAVAKWEAMKNVDVDNAFLKNRRVMGAQKGPQAGAPTVGLGPNLEGVASPTIMANPNARGVNVRMPPQNLAEAMAQDPLVQGVKNLPSNAYNYGKQQLSRFGDYLSESLRPNVMTNNVGGLDLLPSAPAVRGVQGFSPTIKKSSLNLPLTNVARYIRRGYESL